MKLTVIVPVYNVEPYLKEFMNSLQAQTFQDFNVIAIDDKSTDGSAFILETYRNVFKDRLIIIYNQQNVGAGNARNIGMENISGKEEYILFLDADDYLEANFFAKMVSAADENQADLVICGLERFEDPSGNHFKREMVSNPETVITDISNCRELAYINTFLWNKLFRRTIIEHVRFKPLKRWEDMFFLFEVLMDVKRIKFVNEVLYHYRLRKTSLMRTITHEIYESVLGEIPKVIIEFQGRTEQFEQIREKGRGVCRANETILKCYASGVAEKSVFEFKRDVSQANKRKCSSCYSLLI